LLPSPTSDPRRILFLDSWLRERSLGSGSAVAIAGLAAGLESLGHSVATLRPERAYPSLDLTRLSYNLDLERRLRALEEPDLVVGFDFDGGLLPPGLPASRYVVALKGVMADEARFESGGERRRFLRLARLEARNARSADLVICTSRYSGTQARRHYGIDEDRVRIVPEGIWSEEWAGLGERALAERAARDRGPVLLSVARQYRRKNTQSLLRAFASLRRTHSGAALRIVGEGPELPSLRSLAGQLGIEDVVSFVGSLDGMSSLQKEYARADIFCLPSLQEGFGIVYLEAMAAGLPIVAARAGAVPEVAPEEEVSLLVPPDDDQALAEALHRLAESPDRRRELGMAGLRRWTEYDWTLVANQFLAACFPAGEATIRP
jgi:glycosyltransferase involved in cell wall biosynthesis